MKLHLATGIYDRTRALADGSVKVDGVDLEHTGLFAADLFRKLFQENAFDAAELGLTFYLGTLDQDEPPFIAIPVFPVRFFRHSAIYVNRDKNIRTPQDLNGRRIGEMFFYGHDGGVWQKGILAEEYGVDIASLHHFVGGVHHPMPEWNWLPFNPALRSQVKVEHIGPQRTLVDMLEAGEIDALFSALVPPSFGKPGSRIERLFPDYESVERDYFRRTGIFPIMHTVVLRREIHQRHPGLARALYNAFNGAKQAAEHPYHAGEPFMHTGFMVPWLTALHEKNRADLGDDWWPYGVAANHRTLDAFLRYHHEQGLSKRRYRPEDIFAPETLDL